MLSMEINTKRGLAAGLDQALKSSSDEGQSAPKSGRQLVEAADEHALFEKFAPGPMVSPPHDCIHHAYQDQVARDPNAVAVTHGARSISYGELDRRANALAVTLWQNGVRPGDAVGLFLSRSIEMVIGIVAVLKAGAAYVPQDARIVPAPMLQSVMTSAAICVVLTTSDYAHTLPRTSGDTQIAIDTHLGQADGFAPDRATHPDDLCFVLFTSGTTGKPNGVEVTHANVCNIILTQPGDLGMAPGMTVAQLLNIGFDMAAWEILGALSHGATLLIRGDDFTETARHADVIIATPSVLCAIDSAQCGRAKTVAVAGEPCPRPLADEWASFCAFYNCCGPTETTIVNTMQRHHPDKQHLTIGKPTPNNTVYILDDQLKPLPIGAVGEMWAGGACVTKGYISNPDLTADRYRPDPFRPGQMMFRTRDLGRWTDDGELEHFGRVDDQVKVRGFRVELDSVSTAMERASGCRKAVTLKLDARNLVGFVSPANVDAEAAQAEVRNALPYYCEPLFVLAMDELPRTSRGKVDKNALMDLAQAHQKQTGVAS